MKLQTSGRGKLNLNKSTPGVKKEQPNTKKALLKRCEIEMDIYGLLLLIGLRVLVMITILQNIYIVISSTQRLLMLIGSKILIKMTRLQNFFCREVIMTKLLIYQTQETLASHFDFTSFSTKAF